MRKYQCNTCGIRICTAEYQDGSGVPFKCTCFIDKHGKPQWKEIAELQKLTAAVFDRPDCPEWTRFAVVDSLGNGYFYKNTPIRNEEGWHCIPFEFVQTIGKFDAYDWENSLIERPAKALPDWCKVGEWFWHPEDMAGGRYLKITEIRGGGVYAKEKEDYDPDYLCFDLVRKYSKQARLRPWTFEDAPTPLKVKGKSGKYWIAELNYSDVSEQWCYYMSGHESRNDFAITFDGIAKESTQLDGSPCGILEHFKNGEWVK